MRLFSFSRLSMALYFITGSWFGQVSCHAQSRPLNQSLHFNKKTAVVSQDGGGSYPINETQSNGLASQLNFDFRIVANDKSGILVAKDAASLAGMIKATGKLNSIVWARYNPGDASGVIAVTRLSQSLKKEAVLHLTPYTPKDGERWAINRGTVEHYGGVNPFAAFNQADQLFHKINLDGFLVAVGHAMRESKSALAYVGVLNLQQSGSENTSGADLYHQVSTDTNGVGGFKWIIATPLDAPGEQSFTVSIPVEGCLTARDLADRCVAKAGVSFLAWKDDDSPLAVGSYQLPGRVDPYAAQAIFSAMDSVVWHNGFRYSSSTKVMNGELTASGSMSSYRRESYYQGPNNAALNGQYQLSSKILNGESASSSSSASFGRTQPFHVTNQDFATELQNSLVTQDGEAYQTVRNQEDVRIQEDRLNGRDSNTLRAIRKDRTGENRLGRRSVEGSNWYWQEDDFKKGK